MYVEAKMFQKTNLFIFFWLYPNVYQDLLLCGVGAGMQKDTNKTIREPRHHAYNGKLINVRDIR